MSTAYRYQPHYTIADYQHWEGDWELWQGTAVAMTPSPFGPHSMLIARLAQLIGNAIDQANCDAVVLVEIDWIISEDTILRPDLTVICGPAPERHVEEVPALAVEILSDATRERDQTFKKQIYEQAGLPWYLIVDPDSSEVNAWKLTSDLKYEPIPLTGELTIDLCESCRIKLSSAELFR